MYKPNIGERVLVSWNRKKQEVTLVDIDDGNYLVQFNEYSSSRHSGDGYGEHGYYWYYSIEDIEPASREDRVIAKIKYLDQKYKERKRYA